MSRGWETVKDHQICRARDFKPVQVVVAHLKTLFFMKILFKTTVRKQLVKAAISYSKMLNVKIIISSDLFNSSKKYILRFYKTNFLHLTGVKTNLTAEDFFNKCLYNTITEDDFDCDSTNEIKGFVRQKIKHLINFNSIFAQKLFVQEDFVKGKVSCNIATTNGDCTIGFIDAKYCYRPRTILDKNHLDKQKNIVEVYPVVEKI